MSDLFDGLESVSILVTSILIFLITIFMASSFYGYTILPKGGMIFFWVFDFWLTQIINIAVIMKHAFILREKDRVNE